MYARSGSGLPVIQLVRACDNYCHRMTGDEFVNKPVVLTFVAHYLPGYKAGGPVRSIANLVAHLGNEFEFRVVTSDRDSFDDRPYPGVSVDAWNEVGNTQVHYCSPQSRSMSRLSQLIRATPHDLLYLNSIFNPIFTGRPLLARRLGKLPPRPVVIAPRGELSKGALHFKRFRKRQFMRLARALGLLKDVIWQASSQYEADEIRQIVRPPADRIVVAPNLPPPPKLEDPIGCPSTNNDAGAGPLKVVFLSRVSPKKNLDYALRVLSEVSVPVDFSIYGVIGHAAYWEECRRLIARLPHNVTAHYAGVVPHEEVPAVLSEHDLFLLPTRGENYGHAIIEALAAGVPVLISDQTPWDDVEEEGVGWTCALSDQQAFIGAVEWMARADPAERHDMRRRARAYATRLFGSMEVVDCSRRLFRTALELT